MHATETELVKACLAFLTAQGCKVWRANTGAATIRSAGKCRFVRFGPVGQPDIIGTAPGGQSVYVECKRGRNQLTHAQAEFLAVMAQIGAWAVCVYSVDELAQKWRELRATS